MGSEFSECIVISGFRQDILEVLSGVCPKHVFILYQGKLLGICGSVGSGKTSLISAIIGQVTAAAAAFITNGSHRLHYKKTVPGLKTLQGKTLFFPSIR